MNTRKQILNATERIIQSRGLLRATTKEIAREAGCAEGTLYKHFGNKEDLFLSIIQENLPHFLETLQEHQPGTYSVQTNLEDISNAVLLYFDKLIPLAASFFADIELLTRYREMLQDMNTGPLRLYERVAEYVQAEQHLGRINAQLDALNVSALLLGACFQYIFNRHFLGTNLLPITDHAFIKGVVSTLIRGLEPE